MSLEMFFTIQPLGDCKKYAIRDAIKFRDGVDGFLERIRIYPHGRLIHNQTHFLQTHPERVPLPSLSNRNIV